MKRLRRVLERGGETGRRPLWSLVGGMSAGVEVLVDDGECDFLLLRVLTMVDVEIKQNLLNNFLGRCIDILFQSEAPLVSDDIIEVCSLS